MLWATPHWKRHLQKIFAYSVRRLCILSTVSFTAQRPFSPISPTCVWVCFFRPRRQTYKRIARANVRFYCLCFILENFWFWVLYIGFLIHFSLTFVYGISKRFVFLIFFFLHASIQFSLVNTLYRKDRLDIIIYSRLFCCRLIGSVRVGLFLGSQSC